jgi:acetyl esterase/lipase
MKRESELVSPDRSVLDPDGQMPLPYPAAEDYARTVTTWASDAITPDVVAERDVSYGEHRLHRYNVFAPRGAKRRPILVFWHGGGWTNGYREWVTFMAPHVTRLGFVLVAPSYRLAPADPLPAAFEDSVRLLAHVAAEAARWGGDADRLYLAGHSAGGHLAALAALRNPAPRDGAVRGCLPISGIMDLHHPNPAPGSLEERVYTMVLSEPAQDAAMSPLCWTAGNRVPFVLTCGDGDSERVLRSNKRMAALLRLQPAAEELHVERGQDHFRTHTSLRDHGHPWYARLSELADSGRLARAS